MTNREFTSKLATTAKQINELANFGRPNYERLLILSPQHFVVF